MFLKYRNLEAMRLNEIVIEEEAHRYKFYVEDVFQLHYITWTKLNDILLTSGYANDDEKKIILHDKQGAVKAVIMDIGLMKSFESFNYTSFWGCMQMFFRESPWHLAIVFSLFFIIFSLLPSAVLRNSYKVFIKIRHQETWPDIWRYITIKNSEMSKGSRRLIC